MTAAYGFTVSGIFISPLTMLGIGVLAGMILGIRIVFGAPRKKRRKR
jgi:energy-converting hydrogenase Eha subunit A